MQGAGCGLLGQGEKLRNIDIYVDVVCIPFTLRQSGIIADELQVDFIQVKAVVLDLHKTALGILTDDLTPVVLRYRLVVVFHPNHTFTGSRSLAAASTPSVSKGRAIPFGNDYLFIANKEGEIQSWKKFHSRLIPVEATEQMPMIAFPVHSHLKYEPFISATDICTFRLYYNKTGSTKFAVYSTALSMYFIYELATNTITPTKDINFNSAPLSEKVAP